MFSTLLSNKSSTLCKIENTWFSIQLLPVSIEEVSPELTVTHCLGYSSIGKEVFYVKVNSEKSVISSYYTSQEHYLLSGSDKIKLHYKPLHAVNSSKTHLTISSKNSYAKYFSGVETISLDELKKLPSSSTLRQYTLLRRLISSRSYINPTTTILPNTPKPKPSAFEVFNRISSLVKYKKGTQDKKLISPTTYTISGLGLRLYNELDQNPAISEEDLKNYISETIIDSLNFVPLLSYIYGNGVEHDTARELLKYLFSIHYRFINISDVTSYLSQLSQPTIKEVDSYCKFILDNKLFSLEDKIRLKSSISTSNSEEKQELIQEFNLKSYLLTTFINSMNSKLSNIGSLKKLDKITKSIISIFDSDIDEAFRIHIAHFNLNTSQAFYYIHKGATITEDLIDLALKDSQNTFHEVLGTFSELETIEESKE